MALLIGGCPKRQATRLVYVPAPPSASVPSPVETMETWVIEEPAPPPEVSGVALPKSSQPRPTRQRRQAVRPEPPVAAEPAPEEVGPPSVEVPPLESRESREQQAGMRQEILGLQEDIKQRIARLDRVRLADRDTKTLEDARIFLAQSGRAVQDGDLQRSLNLARKASLLVAALEQDQ